MQIKMTVSDLFEKVDEIKKIVNILDDINTAVNNEDYGLVSNIIQEHNNINAIDKLSKVLTIENLEHFNAILSLEIANLIAVEDFILDELIDE